MKSCAQFINVFARRVLSAVGAFLILVPTLSHAATYSWDATNTVAGRQDGAGAWSTSAANWSAVGDGSDDIAWVQGSSAIFGGAATGLAGTVTVSGGIYVSNMTFSAPASGAYTISSSSLALTNGPTITVNSGGDATMASNLRGNNGFIKDGPGMLTLNVGTSNFYTGTVIVTNGTLNITSGTGKPTIDAGGLLVYPNGTFEYGSGKVGLLSFNASITNAGGTIQWGSLETNPLVNFVMQGGLLTNNTTADRGILVSNAMVFESGTIAFNPNAPGNSKAMILAGPAGLTKTTAGTLYILGNTNSAAGNVVKNAYMGITTLSGGILNIGYDLAIGTNPPAFSPNQLTFDGGTLQIASTYSWGTNRGVTLTANGGTIDIMPGLSQTIRVPIAGAAGGSLTKFGSGTLTLNTNNTYDGNTTISNGVLALSGNGSIASSPTITIVSGTTFNVAAVSAGPWTLGGGQVLAGSGTVTGNVAFASGALIQPGTNALKLTIQGNLTLNNNTIVVDAGGATLPVGVYRLIDYTGTESGSFNPTPTIVNGSTAATPTIDDSTPGAVDLVVGTPCLTAGISSEPTDVAAFIGNQANFSLTATGTAPAYQWQISTDGGSSFNNVTTGTGGTTASYQTDVLTLGDSGHKFRAIVNVSCDSSSVTSSVVALTVGTAPIYRSAASGSWNTNATWEISTNGGGTWIAALTSPNADNSTNILVQSGHSVTNNILIPEGVDDLTIQSGGAVVVSGVTFTINNGSPALDCDVAGVLAVDNTSGGSVAATGSVKFENGGKYIWGRAALITIPIATWATGSTCEIQNGAAGTPVGMSQKLYNVAWNFPSQNVAISLAGALTNVSGDLTISASANPANSLRFVGSEQTNSIFVAGNVFINSGYLTMSGGAASNTVVNLNVAGNFVIASGAFLDNRSSGSNCVGNVVFDGTGSQYFTNNGTITHTAGSAALGFKVNSGANVTLVGNNITIATISFGWIDTFTVDGTLNFGTSQITGTGALVVDSGGVLVGNGTNQLTTGLSSVSYGGTLDIQTGLPALVAGDNFLLFGAGAYSGAFANLLPVTPGAGLAWDTTNLTTSGILAVIPGAVVGPATNPTNLVSSVGGGNLTLNWPADHIGWTLQTQTNSRSVGLNPATNAWFDVSGSVTTNQAVIPISPIVPTVFYRLKL